ncbi:MAG: hypothetical protein SH809_17930, partial [Rhodothermales bacterium]|nr:hypothetical protein [Rhodothermales bacterium]
MRTPRSFTWLLLVAFLSLAGCDETVNPFVGLEEPYSLYGYLNPRVSRQTLRVIPIEQRIDNEPSASIDAVVSSTHLASGEVTTWRSTFVQFDDSTFGNVFVGDFRPAYGETYRVDVSRSDGATASAQVTVPVDIRILPEPNASPTVLSFIVESTSLPNIVQADMLYDTVRLQPLASGLNPIRYPITRSYRGQEEAGDGGWRFFIEIGADYQFIKNEFEAHCLTRDWIGVRAMRFTVFIGDDAWVPPGGDFDPEVLAQPDLFSNVENGFGYVGAGYPVSFNAIQPAAVLGAVGFATTGPCDPARTPLTDP